MSQIYRQVAQLLQLNSNLQRLLKEYQSTYKNYVHTFSNPNKTQQNRNNANARYKAARKAVLNSTRSKGWNQRLIPRNKNQMVINRLLKADEIVRTMPVYVQQPNGANAVAFRTA